MRIPTDTELLLSSGQGDRDAFTLLVQRHHRTIIQFVHRFLATSDRATVEDLAQQVFLNAWKYAPTFQPRAKVLTWLLRIATNACLNYRRSEQSWARAVPRKQRPQAEDDGGWGTADRDLERLERAQEVRAAVAALPANQRAMIVLRHFHGLSYREIAEVTATSTSAVDSLLHRARRTLCAKLGAGKDENSPQCSSS